MTQRKRLIISVAAGILAAICALLFLWSQAQSAAFAHDQIVDQFEGGAQRVLIARNRVESGTALNKSLFDEQTWPGLCLPEGTISADEFDQLEGHRTAATILAGEALNSMRVFDQQLPLDRLKAGMTAVTLPADNVTALGGEILRGMRLNLMVANSDGRVVKLADDIEVLSANTSAVQQGASIADGDSDTDSARLNLIGAADTQSLSGGNEPLHWVTLSIPDNQVEQILTASRAGAIHLVLPKALSFDASAKEGE